MRTTSKTPNNLRQIRTAQARTIVQIGESAGVDPSYIARLERGERSPTLGVARRVAGALSVEVAAIWPVSSERTAAGAVRKR